MSASGIKGATPRWMLWCSIGLAWAAAVATALLFWRLGVVLDGGRFASGEIIGMLGLGAAAAGFAGAGVWFAQWAPAEAERAMRRLVVSRVFDLGVVGTHNRTGELLSAATIGVEKTATYRAGFLGPIIGALTTPFVVLAVMAATVDASIAGGLALLVLLVPVLLGGFQRLVSPIGAAYRRTQLALSRAFLEAVQAIDTLVYARAAGRAGARLAERGEAHRRGVMRLLAGNQVLIFVVDAAFSLTVVVAAGLLAASRISTGTLTLGQGLAILLMTTLVIGPVDVIGQFFYIGIAGRASQRELTDLVDDPAQPADSTPAASGTASSSRASLDHRGPALKAGPRSPRQALDGEAAGAGTVALEGEVAREGEGAGEGDGEGAGTILLERVTAGWPDGPDVLDGLSLRVEAGERLALVGPSGVGKSTLSAVLQGQLAPRAGSVRLDGHDVVADPVGARERIAAVEQRTFLFLGSIADNLRVAAPDAPDARLWEALELAGLRAEVEAMPDGLATQVGEHGRLLSGGQAQRLSIARAALRDAPILILDEPTSQVDLAGEAVILAALDLLASGRTVLLIAHRPGAILAADRVVELDSRSQSLNSPSSSRELSSPTSPDLSSPTSPDPSPLSSRDLSPTSSPDLSSPTSPDLSLPTSPDLSSPPAPDLTSPSSPRRRGSLNPPAEDSQ